MVAIITEICKARDYRGVPKIRNKIITKGTHKGMTITVRVMRV